MCVKGEMMLGLVIFLDIDMGNINLKTKESRNVLVRNSVVCNC